MASKLAPDRNPAVDRKVFRVLWDGNLLETYDPERFPTTRDVTDDLVTRWSSLGPEGFEEWDLTIWRDGRVVAVVRTGASGSPEVTHFADIPD